MNPTSATACSASLGLLLSGIVVSFPGIGNESPAGVVGFFWLFVLLAWPMALYAALLVADFVADRAPGVDQTPLILNAHLLGLALAGLALAMILLLKLLLSGLDVRAAVDLLPRGLTAAVAGGTGLAVGALAGTGERNSP